MELQKGPRRKATPLEPEKDIAAGTRTLVVGPYLVRSSRTALGSAKAELYSNTRSPHARLEEASGLAAAIDLDVVRATTIMLQALRPATYLGKGKVEELGEFVRDEKIDLVVMDCALSPVQQRNLEKVWLAKVIDRTGLVLEIFGRRARTKEGTLQVELAHLGYQKSRLARWTGRNPDRGRPALPMPESQRCSTRMTKAEVLAEDMLFATLDPTTRAISLPHGCQAILSPIQSDLFQTFRRHSSRHFALRWKMSLKRIFCFTCVTFPK